ncbi:MAG: polymer-forming cytoskeletal protein [Oscillospiraceae bacterium]
MKNQDNNFKRALLKELTGFASYKDKENADIIETVDDDDDDESFDFIPMTKTPENTVSTENTVRSQTPTIDERPSYQPQAQTQTPTAPEEPTFNYNPNQTRPSAESMATSTVSRATVINGGIQTRENIFVEGVVNGDIVSKGKVSIKGKVEGNVTGFDVELSCEELSGDINCESKAIIHAQTKLKGNLYAGRATVIGTVEGNIIAKESIELLDNAVVYGDIKAASISVAEGAVIYGMVTIGKTKPDSATY